MKTDHRYLMVQVVTNYKVKQGVRTIPLPTFYLDMHQLGIIMNDQFTPSSQKQVDAIIQSIVNPTDNEFLTIASVTTMVCHSEFQPMTPDGVETIEEGTNQKSPKIMYINSGDTYHTTVLFYNNNFHIGDWGTIVENGNYPSE